MDPTYGSASYPCVIEDSESDPDPDLNKSGSEPDFYEPESNPDSDNSDTNLDPSDAEDIDLDLPSSLSSLLAHLVIKCINDLADRAKHPLYAHVLSGNMLVRDLLDTTHLTFGPGLLGALQGDTPPTCHFFETLPSDFEKRWAVYVNVLRKDGHKPLVYIGSGTNATAGVSIRLTQYRTNVQLPQHVTKAKADGFKVVHQGLLCWMPIPTAADVPVTRLLMVALEGVFTFHFWSLKCNTKYAYGVAEMCPWPKDGLP